MRGFIYPAWWEPVTHWVLDVACARRVPGTGPAWWQRALLHVWIAWCSRALVRLGAIRAL